MQLPGPGGVLGAGSLGLQGLDSARPGRGAAASGPHVKQAQARQHGCSAGAPGEPGLACWDGLLLISIAACCWRLRCSPVLLGALSISRPRASLTAPVGCLRRVLAPGLAPSSSSYLKTYLDQGSPACPAQVCGAALRRQAPLSLLHPSALGLLPFYPDSLTGSGRGSTSCWAPWFGSCRAGLVPGAVCCAAALTRSVGRWKFGAKAEGALREGCRKVTAGPLRAELGSVCRGALLGAC